MTTSATLAPQDSAPATTALLASVAAVSGRLLLAGLFITSGVGKIAAPAMTIGYIKSVGLPLPEVAFAGAVLIEIVGSLAGATPVPMGNDNFTSSPSGTFAAVDGALNIAINTQEQYEKLVQILGDSDIAADPRFRDRESRKVHRQAMSAALERALQARPAAEWVRLLSAAGVPAGHVLSVAEAFELPQVAHRELVQTFTDVAATGGDLKVMRPGFRRSGGGLGVDTPPPELGRDTPEILKSLGYSPDDIAALRAARAV